jgi:hypothetical protein
MRNRIKKKKKKKKKREREKRLQSTNTKLLANKLREPPTDYRERNSNHIKEGYL